MSRHYVVVLTKAERDALLSLLEPVLQNRQDYAMTLYRAASAAYDKLLLKAEGWAPIARGCREAIEQRFSGEEETEGEFRRLAAARTWLTKQP